MPFAYTGELAALATACFWTITALAFESASMRVGSLAVNFIRLAVAFVFLCVFCLVTRGLFLPIDASPHNWIWLSVSGLVGFTFGDLCLFRALVLMGSRLSMLLMALVPPLTAALGFVFLKERLDMLDLAGMALAVGGVAFVVLEKKDPEEHGRARVSKPGILLGLGGALGQALGLVLSKVGMQGYDAFASAQIRVIAGTAGFAVLFCCVGWWPKTYAALKNKPAMSRLALGALFGPFLGVSLSLVAVKHTTAGVAATLMALVPVLIIAPSAVIRKERVSARAIAGAVAAVCGSALLFI